MMQGRKIRQVFLKLLVAAVIMVGVVGLFRWGLLPLTQWALALDEATISTVRRVGILLSVVLAYWVYVRFYEKRAMPEMSPAPLAITAGALSGAAMIALASIPLFAFGVYEISAVRGLNAGLLGVAGVILVAATMEELVFRGLIFQALERAWGTVPALWLQSLLFSVLHIANLDSNMGTPELVMTVISGTLIGAFWTVLFVKTRNLWVVAANHAAWNFAVVLTGLPLSGLDDWRALAPLESQYHGPNWLSGGLVGPEDSIVTVLMVAAALALLLLWARRDKRFLAAQVA
ncbi:CPBP family intramembrane glutamic endopeptidase [Shewanella sedimentimangrovi]|uniref:CPBP family intramembrane metalloprotease n=1 Tax=Shewanella sedimentimangrovi TaxID=2814293 RepID=A0ABX7QZD5_9GAMM|nr:type II CAAX endopeptidase family protein [Shewanella sedimentimangrovi]QSX36412.1 CPBP family intramembrane metalloprotease [Shewanella sedimentimangrovi]